MYFHRDQRTIDSIAWLVLLDPVFVQRISCFWRQSTLFGRYKLPLTIFVWTPFLSTQAPIISNLLALEVKIHHGLNNYYITICDWDLSINCTGGENAFTCENNVPRAVTLHKVYIISSILLIFAVLFCVCRLQRCQILYQRKRAKNG